MRATLRDPHPRFAMPRQTEWTRAFATKIQSLRPSISAQLAHALALHDWFSAPGLPPTLAASILHALAGDGSRLRCEPPRTAWLSHAPEDAELAKLLSDSLRLGGATLMHNPAALYEREDAAALIADTWQLCERLVLVWTKWAATSELVQTDLRRGRDSGSAYLALVLDNTPCPISSQIRLGTDLLSQLSALRAHRNQGHLRGMRLPKDEYLAALAAAHELTRQLFALE